MSVKYGSTVFEELHDDMASIAAEAIMSVIGFIMSVLIKYSFTKV